MSYSLADLTQIVGAKRRTIQLWAEAKVIKADATTERAGTGYHRQFTQTEAIIACLVFPFAIRQISIGELLSISDAIRRYLKQRNGREIIHRVIKGSAIGYLTITTWSNSEVLSPRRIRSKALRVPSIEGPTDVA